MIETRKLLRYFGKLYPKRIAKENHDFVGLMTGKLPEKIERIVICLDLDRSIIEEVLAFKPDIVFTHHPFIYGTRFQVFKKDEDKKEFSLYLDEINLPVYSLHTNFDSGKQGMNDALAEKLELINIRPLENNPMARGGELKEPRKIAEFASFAIKVLNVPYGLLINKGEQLIKSVAIVGGAGSRSWKIAKEEGYDLFISGDVPHYVRRDIELANYNYLDLPHEIENIFMEQLKKVLLDLDPALKIKTITHEIPPKVIRV